MVERRNQRRACLVQNGARDLFAIFHKPIVGDDFRSPISCCLHLCRGSVSGHDNGRGRTNRLRHDGCGLRVITGREGDYAPRQVPRRDRQNPIRRPTNLERAATLQIFALEKSSRVGPPIQALRRHNGCAVDVFLDAGCGLPHVGCICRKLHYREACSSSRR